MIDQKRPLNQISIDHEDEDLRSMVNRVSRMTIEMSYKDLIIAPDESIAPLVPTVLVDQFGIRCELLPRGRVR
jgi:hypothetical protein